ncbi:MAG: hypothetical protein J3K34DRAFT_440567 [Monoraphidium minutum]|nr:MAG: hypothetical protein J3K34DRAFT_440567 [Monoraphidium minutum]
MAWQAWLVVDGAVAWLAGLDESKYQWALDRYHQRQAELALRARAFDGELSTSAPHVPPSTKATCPDAENP